MALKDSFINLNKALRTTLQNVPAVVDTLIRGFDEIGDAAEEESTYSTDERVVGKWIDGSDIYEKVIDFGALPNNTTKSVNITSLEIDKVISITGAAASRGLKLALPFVYPETQQINIATAYISGNNLNITDNTDLSGYNGIVIIRYTKTSASRSPKNDTKNGDEDEPGVKTVEEPAEELKK